MVQILQNFQQMVIGLGPLVLVGGGLACVVIGLFVWLGGLGFRNILTAAIGGAVGGLCGYVATNHNLGLTAVAAIVSGFFAVAFERVFITVLTVVLTVLIGFVVVADMHNADFNGDLEQVYLAIPILGWLLIAGLAAGSILVAFYLWRFVSALCCSTLGTMLVFAGMILLLVSKGAAPATAIGAKTTLYAGICLGMVAFGTVEQLVICPLTRQEQIAARQKEREENENQPDVAKKRKKSWRTQ
jgi:hypothetical protein